MIVWDVACGSAWLPSNIELILRINCSYCKKILDCKYMSLCSHQPDLTCGMCAGLMKGGVHIVATSVKTLYYLYIVLTMLQVH